MGQAKLDPPKLGEPYLLTPGPLTTSYATKQAMLRDWGSWDSDFRAMTAAMRAQLLEMIGPGADDFDCVPMARQRDVSRSKRCWALCCRARQQDTGAGERRFTGSGSPKRWPI